MTTNTLGGPKRVRPRPAASYTFRMPGIVQDPDPMFRYLNGSLAMTGWVRTAAGVPQQRRVVLKVFPSMIELAYTLSDASNGGNNYFFNGLKSLAGTGESYTLEVHHVDGTSAPRIKDMRVPV